LLVVRHTDSMQDEVEENKGEVDMEGVLLLSKGKIDKKGKVHYKKPKQSYFTLLGGALYFYKKTESSEPSGVFKLAVVELREMPEDEEAEPHSFELRPPDKKLSFLLTAVDGEASCLAWVAALKANAGKEVQPPLPKEKATGLVRRLARRTTQNLAGKAAMSPMGKRAIRNRLPREIVDLIEALKIIVQKESHSQKKADRMEGNIYKIGVKLYFLGGDKKISMDELAVMDQPFRQALTLFTKIRYQAHAKRDANLTINMEKLKEILGEVRVLVMAAGDSLKKLLMPHIQLKNLARVDEILSYITDPEVVIRILLNPELDSEVFDLESAAEHYCQFHYYVD